MHCDEVISTTLLRSVICNVYRETGGIMLVKCVKVRDTRYGGAASGYHRALEPARGDHGITLYLHIVETCCMHVHHRNDSIFFSSSITCHFLTT